MRWFLFFPFFLFAEFSYFIPPTDWQCVQPKNPSPHVQVGFIHPEKGGFRPSINLAIEAVDVSLKEYVQAVKEIHLSQPNTQWRDLGMFSMKAGRGRLTEICNSSPWGPVQMLQALFVHKGNAYILTAAVLRKEFTNYRKELLQSLKSLSLAEDAVASLPDEEQRGKLEQIWTSDTQEKENQWEALQQFVKECKNMGAHWQFLVLKEGHAKLFEAQ